MTAFEIFLIEKGYAKHKYNFDTQKLEPTTEDNLSTMRTLSYIYLNGTHRIEFGLHEQGSIPTLISPRPPGIKTDHDMQRVLMTTPFEEILRSIQ